MNRINKIVSALALLAASQMMASATLQLRLSDGTTTITVVDQGPGDFIPAVGWVGFIGPVGSVWVYDMSAGISKPLVGTPDVPQMDLNSISYSAPTMVPLTIQMTDTGFTGKGPGVAAIGGLTDGIVLARTYIDEKNVAFAKTKLVTTQGPFSGPTFSQDTPFSIAPKKAYSVTLQAILNHPVLSPDGDGPRTGFDLSWVVNPPTPNGGCRTTGGGRQQDSFPPVNFVTHGGQVGAPMGTETAFRPDSPCIRGNWEHVRHGANGSKGNFHAKSFDSLMCACLGCPEDPTSPITLGGLCNPDNRICGPEPRRAPANKITFSGVGDFSESGKRAVRSVLFRVDLEDRSEPGNRGAISNEAPYDRHRIRIWILTAAELTALNNPANRLLGFRKAISATYGVEQTDGAVLIDGTPVPNGTPVFGVRPPDIDDGGVMDHGNHQIHPALKPCLL